MSELDRIKYIAQNTQGRDFVCGDLHGSFDLLERKLLDVKFDRSTDRLFCVGDIIDRGKGSAKALFYLKQSWFYCIRGNHEQMLLDWCIRESARERLDAFRFHMLNGGNWVADFLEVDLARLASDVTGDEPILKCYPQLSEWVVELGRMPFAMEIQHASKTVGLIHAEIPKGIHWSDLPEQLHQPNVLNSILYSRKYINGNPILNQYHIDGIDEIYSGHTILDKRRQIGNVHYIDTGAYTYSNLTLVQL